MPTFEELEAVQEPDPVVEETKPDKTAELEAKLEELKLQNQGLNQRYDRDMSQVGQYVGQILNNSNRPQQAPVEEVDEDTQRSRQNLREEVNQAIISQVSPVVQSYYKSERATRKQLAHHDPELNTILKKWGNEVESLLDSQPPEIAAQPNAYAAACKAIAVQHIDELVEERANAKVANRTQVEEDSDPDNEDYVAPTRTRAPTAPSARAPGSTGSNRKQVRLDDRERQVAGVFGLTAEDYDKYSNDLTSDIYGFRDKSGRMRGRV